MKNRLCMDVAFSFQIFGATMLLLTDFPRKLLTFSTDKVCQHSTVPKIALTCFDLFAVYLACMLVQIGLGFSFCGQWPNGFTHAWVGWANMHDCQPHIAIPAGMRISSSWESMTTWNVWSRSSPRKNSVSNGCMLVSGFAHCAERSLHLNRCWQTATLLFRWTLSQRPT